MNGLSFTESLLWGVSTIGVIALGTHEVPTRWQVVRAGSDRVWSARLEAAALVGTGMGLPVVALLVLAEVPQRWVMLVALVTLVPAGALVPLSWLTSKIEQAHARRWQRQLTHGPQRRSLALRVIAGGWLAAMLAAGVLTVVLTSHGSSAVLLLLGAGMFGTVAYLGWQWQRHRHGRHRAIRSPEPDHHETH